MTAAVEHYLDQFRAFEDRYGGGLPWLAQVRKAALTRFADSGFPTTRNEQWKYTNLRPLEKKSFQLATEHTVAVTPADVAQLCPRDLDAHLLVFVNGVFRPELSSDSTRLQGVHADSIGRSLARVPDLVQSTLADPADYDLTSFAALNTAFLRDGALLRIDRGVQLAKPLHLLYVTRTVDQELVCHPRSVIVLGEHAHLELLETYASGDDVSCFTNAVTEIVCAPNSRLEHYRVQRQSENAFHISSTHVRQYAHSHYVSHNVNIGARLARNDFRVALAADGAGTVLNGLYVCQDRQHIDNHTRIEHISPHTKSDEIYRGIVNDRGRAVFNGKVIVAENAQKIEAHQGNHNLLLSPHAEVDTKPELEIYADDVKCSHGATVGQLDRDALFYLRSRAIGEQEARALLTLAFADEVLGRMRIPAIRDHLRDILMTTLPNGRQPAVQP